MSPFFSASAKGAVLLRVIAGVLGLSMVLGPTAYVFHALFSDRGQPAEPTGMDSADDTPGASARLEEIARMQTRLSERLGERYQQVNRTLSGMDSRVQRAGKELKRQREEYERQKRALIKRIQGNDERAIARLKELHDAFHPRIEALEKSNAELRAGTESLRAESRRLREQIENLDDIAERVSQIEQQNAVAASRVDALETLLSRRFDEIRRVSDSLAAAVERASAVEARVSANETQLDKETTRNNHQDNAIAELREQQGVLRRDLDRLRALLGMSTGDQPAPVER